MRAPAAREQPEEVNLQTLAWHMPMRYWKHAVEIRKTSEAGKPSISPPITARARKEAGKKTMLCLKGSMAQSREC